MWPENVRISVPVPASDSFAVSSPEPVRTRVPSGENATEKTPSVWPVKKVRTKVPVPTSHSFAESSHEPPER